MSLRKAIADVTDAAAGVVVVGVWAEVIPLILGVLGIIWFAIRFTNFIRVNVFHKQPWKGLG